MSDLKRYRPEVGVMKCNMAGQFVKFTDYAELQAQVKQLEAALRHIAEGTWWDGNEQWAFHRVESYALAALQENE